jgi:hypothetical protein
VAAAVTRESAILVFQANPEHPRLVQAALQEVVVDQVIQANQAWELLAYQEHLVTAVFLVLLVIQVSALREHQANQVLLHLAFLVLAVIQDFQDNQVLEHQAQADSQVLLLLA